MRRLGSIAAAAMLLALAASSVNAGSGYDQYGYNLTANSFNGTGSSWCLAGGQGANCMGAYSADKLGMKWNEQWDICNDAVIPDAAACTGAWLNNEWNGRGVKGGSGAVWHYKFVWVGPCVEGTYFDDGGYCIWGAYEVLMDQGQDPSYGPGHTWISHAKPNGYGAFK